MKKICVGESAIHGTGIHAAENIKKGDKIQFIKGEKVKKLPKTKDESLSIPTWFGVSRQVWLNPSKTLFRYLNHSCSPNVAIVGTKTLMAMQDLKKGDEITIDYSMTDADPLWEMACECEAKDCRKTIRSIHFVPLEVFKRHMPHIPKYFQHVYIRNYVHSQLKLSDAGHGHKVKSRD